MPDGCLAICSSLRKLSKEKVACFPGESFRTQTPKVDKLLYSLMRQHWLKIRSAIRISILILIRILIRTLFEFFTLY